MYTKRVNYKNFWIVTTITVDTLAKVIPSSHKHKISVQILQPPSNSWTIIDNENVIDENLEMAVSNNEAIARSFIDDQTEPEGPSIIKRLTDMGFEENEEDNSTPLFGEHMI